MNDFSEIMKHTDNILGALDNLNEIDEDMMLSALCMAIDHCAEKIGKSSMSLLDMISPAIRDVNEAFGAIEVA